MRPHIIYYVAASIDGYIATPDGSVDWLNAFENNSEENSGEDYGYEAFYQSIDGLIMGSHTYEQVCSFGEWVYPGKPCWVLSQRSIPVSQPEVTLTHQPPEAIVPLLEAQKLQRVWLVGGGQIATAFYQRGFLDEFILSLMPIVLGSGIPLLQPTERSQMLELTEAKTFPSGVVQLYYRRKPQS
ncbi:dihydrofolate reductase family protein [Leptolyngbya ohadii]|uniref:dihydrofolate reductase family protein n=1 Tax=Leptolyngbya ohadii TaxID=1962290 RepID=UPI000B5994AD|nr:dihydrofolate reductase family protein [Leptolyngbya ohadii]